MKEPTVLRAHLHRSAIAKTIAAVALLFPIASHAWWNNDWNYRKEITLDSSPAGANVTGSATDVPVLIRLHIGNFGYFGDTKPDGSDLRVIAGDDKTPLKFHIERYDAVNQMAFIWVRFPQLTGASAANKFFLYYGNPKAPAASDSGGTYDPHQALVYHFSETGDAALPKDSSANGNNATDSKATLNAASLIGGGATLNGKDFISTPASASLRLRPEQGMTFSAWARIEAEQSDAVLLSIHEQGNEFVLGIKGAQAYAGLVGTSARAEALQKDALTTGAWHHLTAIFATGKLQLFVDGQPAATTNIDFKPVEIAGTFTIGAGANGTHPFAGEVDEVEVTNSARTPDWVRAMALSEGQETPLVLYGNDAQREGQKVSYFKVTLQNVTPDGWAVIIVLAVMFVIALMIMVSKALYLTRVKKANGDFLKEFAKLRGDPTALDRLESSDGDDALDESPFMPHMKDGEDRFRMSTIYRLYHHGVQELTGRVHARSVGAAAVRNLPPQTLNSQTMDAIRAAMDASSVRMSQKLGSKMVLLTIAISGGPFLGLLGTVVGVMITFAAIAASGDVNVNSIAPGIAAALAATVAGLAVAIPALFGYNWLNTQIKEITADMRVFIDEFVTRVAEEYS